MNNTRTFILTLCLGFFLYTPLQAQEEAYDILILHSGTIIEGTILEIEEGNYVIIKITGSERTKRYKMDSIAQIKQMNGLVAENEATIKTPRKEREKSIYKFEEEGRFTAVNFGFSFGKRNRSDIIFDPIFGGQITQQQQNAIGFNLQVLLGKQYSRSFGIGGGLSYDAYNLEEGESLLTVLGHCRGYLTKSIVSPYWAFSAGYGFALQNETQGVKEAKGGLMFHPELGLRLGASDKTNFTISLGYRFQKAEYIQEFPFIGDIEYRSINYRRFLFSVGLIL